MKSENDKLVKVVMDNGLVFNLYAGELTRHKIFKDERFLRFSDDSNDDILIAADAICGFEVMDDRKEKIEEVKMPELSSGEEG